jgi:ankyrin repeat protein
MSGSTQQETALHPMILPADQYYRPTRARALRRKAERLRGWHRLSCDVIACARSAYRPFFFLCFLLWAASGLFWGWVEGALALLMVSLPGCWLLGSLLTTGTRLTVALEDRIRCWDTEALALEREHQTRYGPGPLTPPTSDIRCAAVPSHGNRLPDSRPGRSARWVATLLALQAAAVLIAGTMELATLWRTVFLNDDVYYGVRRGDAAEVERLLDRGASPDARPSGRAGGTPLMWATAKGDLRIMRILLRRGADVNADEGGTTTLMRARTAEAAELLIRHEANVNTRDRDGRTALDYARGYGSTAVVRILKQHGANDSLEEAE